MRKVKIKSNFLSDFVKVDIHDIGDKVKSEDGKTGKLLERREGDEGVALELWDWSDGTATVRMVDMDAEGLVMLQRYPNLGKAKKDMDKLFRQM